MHVHWCSCPEAVKLHVWLISTQDQKPSAATTGGHSPFGPAACGIARPSAVCAAAMMLSIEPPGAGAPPLVGAPALPPLPLAVGCVLGGRRAKKRICQRERSESALDAETSWLSEVESSGAPQAATPTSASEKTASEKSKTRNGTSDRDVVVTTSEAARRMPLRAEVREVCDIRYGRRWA